MPLIGQILLYILYITLPLLLCVAYLTWFERKVIAAVQLRYGPKTNGPFGLLQPLCDGVKLLFKEIIIPRNSDKLLFLLAPVITFTLALAAWAVIPFWEGGVMSNIDVGVLYLLAISSLSVYGIILAGWASNSKYAFLGAIRSASQMISYEVAIGLVVVCVLIHSGTANLTEIVLQQKNQWYAVPLFPLLVIFFISILAETNRHPFDLPEAEAELVSGYNVEYSSMAFALFFLGEYANMILMSSITVILFMGGWLPIIDSSSFSIIPPFMWFFIKVVFLLFLFIMARATLPRYRYDQLMRLGWKVFLPLSLLGVLIVSYLVVR